MTIPRRRNLFSLGANSFIQEKSLIKWGKRGIEKRIISLRYLVSKFPFYINIPQNVGSKLLEQAELARICRFRTEKNNSGFPD